MTRASSGPGDYLEKSTARAVTRGKLDEDGRGALLGRVRFTLPLEDLADVDFVVERCRRASGSRRRSFSGWTSRVYDEFREPGFAPAPLLEHLVTAGRLGRKTGKGFREYG